MASKIKVDNITDQDNNAVISRCGSTHTVTAEVYKADTIQDTSGNAYFNKCGTAITIGGGSDTTTFPGAAVVTGNVTGANLIASGNVIKSNAYQASDGGVIISQSGTTITLGASGDTVQLAAGTTNELGGGGVDWQTTPKTANFNASAGEGYFIDTSSNTVTVTLPTGVAGESVTVLDYISNANTKSIIFAPQSGEKIEGATSGQGVTANRQATTLTYSGATQGWLVSSSGDSGPIQTPTITFTTASGSLGTLSDTQRSDPAGNLSSAGGTASFGTLSFSVQSGSLPSGVTINSSTGAFAGTANAVASETVSSFTIRATITETGTTSDRAFTITVSAPTITFNTASGSLGTLSGSTQRAAPNTNLSAVTATTSSGTLSYSIQSGSLPGGLTLTSATGAFSGTATNPGSSTVSSFTVRATNTSGTTSDRAFTITVNPDPAFVTATGGTVATSGDFKIHTFNGPGTFSVSCAGNPTGSNTVDYMVVAGGGGAQTSGPGGKGGGGGAGGFRTSSGAASGSYSTSPLGSGVSALSVAATSYPITVGGGGGGSPNITGLANSGGNSTFSNITSAGGGAAGGNETSANGNVGTPGGSGGGGGGGGSHNGPGGSGNTPPVSPPQGNPGGASTPNGPSQEGGGGGGAGGSGGTNELGPGTPSTITGSGITYSEGGYGFSNDQPSPKAPGPANSGDGGSGTRGQNTPAASGGSGIVVIRYKYQ